MEPLAQGAIRFLHRSDCRKHGAFPGRLILVRARFRLQLFGAISHRGFFLVCESLGLLIDRGGALSGLLRALLFRLAHKNLLIVTWVGNLAVVRLRTRAILVMRRLMWQ